MQNNSSPPNLWNTKRTDVGCVDKCVNNGNSEQMPAGGLTARRPQISILLSTRESNFHKVVASCAFVTLICESVAVTKLTPCFVFVRSCRHVGVIILEPGLLNYDKLYMASAGLTAFF